MLGDAASGAFGELRHHILAQGIKAEASEDDAVLVIYVRVLDHS